MLVTWYVWDNICVHTRTVLAPYLYGITIAGNPGDNVPYLALHDSLFGIMSGDTNTDGREDIALPETHYRNPNLRTDGRYFINNSRSVTLAA